MPRRYNSIHCSREDPPTLACTATRPLQSIHQDRPLPSGMDTSQSLNHPGEGKARPGRLKVLPPHITAQQYVEDSRESDRKMDRQGSHPHKCTEQNTVRRECEPPHYRGLLMYTHPASQALAVLNSRRGSKARKSDRLTWLANDIQGAFNNTNLEKLVRIMEARHPPHYLSN